MGVSGEVRVVGVTETLKALKDLDPALRRQCLAEMRKAAQPLAGAVSAALPAGPPISGMARGAYPYTAGSRKATARTGGRKRGDEAPLVSIRVPDAGAVAADMSGRKSAGEGSGATMIAALTARGGSASRYVWPAAEQALPTVQAAVVDACEAAARQVQVRLDVRPAGG